MEYVALEKLKWRSRRSMLELDLYFERFIQSGEFARLNEAELIAYQQILTMDDGDLLLLFQDKQRLDKDDLQLVIDKITHCDF